MFSDDLVFIIENGSIECYKNTKEAELDLEAIDAVDNKMYHGYNKQCKKLCFFRKNKYGGVKIELSKDKKKYCDELKPYLYDYLKYLGENVNQTDNIEILITKCSKYAIDNSNSKIFNFFKKIVLKFIGK